MKIMRKYLCCLFSVLLMIGLVACQSAPKPEDTVKGYFEAGKNFDTAKMSSFVNPKNVSSGSSSSGTSSDSGEAELEKYCMDYLKGNAKKITYRIKGSDVKDSTATITVDCKYVDGSPILRDAVSDYMVKAFGEAFSGTQSSSNSSKEIAQIMTDKMKTTKETFTTKTIKINCVKIDKKWYIDKINDDLSDVFLSGFVSAGKEISKSFSNSNSSASSESGDKSNSSLSASKFKNNILTTDDLKIEITKYKVIAPGKKGNEYGEKPVVAFWYKATNISGKELDPNNAWLMSFKAIQDNDPNSVNELNIGSLPDDKFLDTQSHEIKKGGTVENAVAYELSDTKTPVTLKATDPSGKNSGEQIFDIK